MYFGTTILLVISMVLVLTALTTISLRNLVILPVTAYNQTNTRDYAFKAVNSTTNLTNQTTNAAGLEERRVPSFNGKLEPSAISGDNSTKGQLLTTQMVANQLTTMTPDKIANFPLKDLSSTESQSRYSIAYPQLS